MVNKVRSIDFLPEVFKTHTNQQFLNATLDLLTSQPDLKRVEGFIGEKYGYGVGPNDKYVVEPTKSRRDYQLDPGVIFLKPETQTAQDFINYPGIVDALKLDGANVTNHDRLFNNQFYSWDPFVDYDKIVNYTQYYWIPEGPDAIPLSPTIVYDSGTYTVTQDDNGYQFSQTSTTNPEITLIRGGEYEFDVPPGSTDFWIQTVSSIAATPTQRTISGVTNNGTDNGVVTFVVPDKATLLTDRLYYRSGSDPLSVGIINLIETNAANYINVGDILGQKTYTSPNGVAFTNGIKISFGNTVYPDSYKNNEYYVSGVGSAIMLLPVINYVAAELNGGAQLPEYITIERNSRDLNAWTRANRWFHQDVLTTTTKNLGYVTIQTDNTVTRAQRPIIEYRGNLKLINSGSVSIGQVDIVSVATDALSQIEGLAVSAINTSLTDGITLYQGARIIFKNDTNPSVRQNVYIANLVPAGPMGSDIVSLTPDTSIAVIDGRQVYVLSGEIYDSTSWYYSDNTWNQSQQKNLLNQYPMYDIVSHDEASDQWVSLSDNDYYSGSNFHGSKLFSYTPGVGTDDPVLGFPIAYSTPSTIGDILFTVNLNSDVFSYAPDNTQNINIGFVEYYPSEGTTEHLLGWVPAAAPSVQPQAFEFPIIDKITYGISNTTITIVSAGSGYSIGDKLKILGSSIGGTSPENDLTFTVQSVSGSGVNVIADDSIAGITNTINNSYFNLDIISMTGVGSSAIANVVISGAGTTKFVCDIPAASNTVWRNVTVYYNDNVLDESQYTVVIDNTKLTTTVTVPTQLDTKVTILLLSDYTSNTAYYQTPSNLENNPFNTDITSVAVGDIRNQYKTIFSNAPGVTGTMFGDNNIHDLGPLTNYGTAIIQNSASLVLPGVFLRKQNANPFNAIQFNSEQYQIYKTLLVDLAESIDYSVYTSPSDILDDIVYQIGTTKNNTSAFFWSDMIFSGNPFYSNTYNFATSATTAIFTLGDAWTSTMFTEANYLGLGIYLTRVVAGKKTVTQLMKNIDYIVSTTASSVQVNYAIQADDVITVKVYNQTYGSYCPSTPSKLGLYPIYIPSVILNDTYSEPTYFILGHDGSYNKLYGNYNPLTDQLDDFRDIVLLEFEKRVYNNYKVSSSIPLTADDVVPGEFRNTEYSRSEILNIYSTGFLNWVGANRIDYKTQSYRSSNKFTYNYNQSSDKLTNQALLQGYWRGIYNWLYDTDNPANAPWEMLGLNTKPSWWDSHYGGAPYTSGNTYMWQDIANGYVWNDGSPYINEKKIRPDLLSVLPVNSLGELVSPSVSIMGNYNSLTFNRDWIVGDGAPAEASYLKSSTWPFDLMRILALTKPAQFFNLFVDRDLYKYDSTYDQYLYIDRYHLDPRTVQVYGNNTAKHSYINWVVDYINQKGADGTVVVRELLDNLDVRLVYNMAGFTAKNYLKFLVEKATPNSKNTSLLIPDENYSVLLYDNPPKETITYSSVIVQKVANGYAVWGNSKNKQYFTIATPKTGAFVTLNVNGSSVQVSKSSYLDKTNTIPYGTVFYSIQAVSEFVLDYGRYLTQQGVQFSNIEDGVVYDWSRMAQEFISWTQQGWEVGSIISLNPSATEFSVSREGLVVQPLSVQNQNFILNQNLLPVQSQDACVVRENEKFSVEILSEGDTVAYTNLNLHAIEHAIVFDNNTSFNDTIYNLATGLRQPRLLLQGYKSGEWNGYVNASGFILNEDNIKEWTPNTKYPKGIIVTYKSNYYTSKVLIEAASEFSKEDWLKTDYGQVKSGLLPNPSTMAYEAEFYYDTNRANLENDVDLLAFSLIGFRPRDYLAAADLSDITQINVYKNIVKTKGTKLLIDSFKSAQFDQGPIDYSVQENWAIKSGSFGSILNRNFVEALLEQNVLTGNPTLIGFSEPNSVVSGVQQSISTAELINYERAPLTSNFLPKDTTSYTVERGLPSAGYVNLDDCKFQEYYFENLNDDADNINNLYTGDNIWIAHYRNSWDIFTATSLNNTIAQLDNNLNNTVTLTFANQHNLVSNDLIAITNVDNRVNGFYTVNNVKSTHSIVINAILDATVSKLTTVGVGFKLVSRRFTQPSDAYDSLLPYTAWISRKIWADYYTDNQWAVYEATPTYKERAEYHEAQNFGVSVGYSSAVETVVTDGTGNIYRYYGDGLTQTLSGGIGTESQLRVTGNVVYCSSPSENVVYVYELDTVTNQLSLVDTIDPSLYVQLTGAIAVSNDNQWLYIADYTNQQIAIYTYDTTTTSYLYVNTVTDGTIATNIEWGKSIAVSTDGMKLVVGAPKDEIDGLSAAGAAYVYTRRNQSFYSTGSTSAFMLANSAPSNVIYAYVNDVLDTGAIASGTTVTLSYVPVAGSVVSISTGYVDFVQKLNSDNPQINAWFGHSVDTNRYGADIVVGCPYETSTVDAVNGVEGAVYHYTNGSQRYGVSTSTFTGSQAGTLFIDGYKVNYNGTIDQIVDDINTSTPTNIIASYAADVLTITYMINTPEVLFNIIDITGAQSSLLNLGIVPYTNTQIIRNPDLTDVSSFGYSVKMNEQDSMVISGITATRLSPTTFDYTDNYNQDDTIFDNDTTIYVDSFNNEGVVYEFDYLPAANESITNPGKYTFGQYITSSSLEESTPQPNFGYSVAYMNTTIVVGTPNWTTTTGGVAVFDTTWTREYSTQPTNYTTWYVDKQPLPIVDVNALNNISIYNVTDNQTLEYLDYIDPGLGKILGAVATNLDFMETVDPAVYNINGVAWLNDHLGNTWLNLNTVRLLNYHQPDKSYNAKNWGKAFPGSTADVYTWVESTTTPLNYTGSGYPVFYDKYNTATVVDKATNSLLTKYYFWVKNFAEIPPGKTLSPNSISAYVLNPLSSGIAYLAPITTNVVALMNSGDYIQSNTSALHIGYGIPNSLDEKHSSWELLRDGNTADFLSGLPTPLVNYPTGLYLKYLESFSGFDSNYNPIPDPLLPALTRYGTEFRPRQSMFIDRLLALKNYITYANDLLIKIPAVEYKDLSYLHKIGTTYDVNQCWEYVNWWEDGYSDSTKPVMEVADVNDLQIISENTLLIGINGSSILVENGMIVKVQANKFSNSEFYVYDNTASTPWKRIGAENSTIQFLPNVWNLYGWSSDGWGGSWDKTLVTEIYWIVRWLNEKCYIDEMLINRNLSLMLMFKYIQSESQEQNNYLTWLNKTSLVDVNHKIRSLLPYKKYQRDNQEFLEGFINEVKPYHVYIKDFVFSYTGDDTYFGNLSDFDLPSQYNSTVGKFQTPELVYQSSYDQNQYLPTSDVWKETEYSEWFNHYGLSITNSELPIKNLPSTESVSGITVSSYPAARLQADLSSTATSAILSNVCGLPSNGFIIIGQEEMSYDGIDILTGVVSGLSRGLAGTSASDHFEHEIVSVMLPSVYVLNTGRGYIEPPKITAYIDTTLYPAPRQAAVLEPIMAADIVIGIAVIDGGSGYAVSPKIIIDVSDISSTFIDSDVNIVNNTITITGHPFITGDSVLYTAGSSNVIGLTDGYYYVRSIDADTIALYENYTESLVNYAGITQLSSGITSSSTSIQVKNQSPWFAELLPATGTIMIDNELISYSSMVVISSTINELQGVTRGVNGTIPALHDVDSLVKVNGSKIATDDGRVSLLSVGDGTLAVCARAECITGGAPVREFNLTIKFDRVSYSPTGGWDSTGWSQWPGWDEVESTAANRIRAYYSPTASMPGKDLPQLMTGIEYENAIIKGQDFVPTVGDITLDAQVSSYSFTGSPDPDNYYNISGGEFMDGFGPEELVAGYITDSLIITIISNDIVPSWTHVLTVNQFGEMNVYNDSGEDVADIYEMPDVCNQWWYGAPSNTSVANTTLTLCTDAISGILRT